MSKIKRYISPLSTSAKLSLEKGYKYGSNSIFRSHCHCILLSASGKDTTELMSIFGVLRNTIYVWFDKWEKLGIEGLKIVPGRGRKPILSINNANDVAIVEAKIAENRRKLSLAKSAMESELNKSFSEKTLKRFLKNVTLVGVDIVKASRANKTKKIMKKKRLL
jgi:transposase